MTPCVGIAGIVGFVLTMIDRRRRNAAAAPANPPGPAEPAGQAPVADGVGGRLTRTQRLLLSPVVFFVAFLGAGLLATLVDDTTDNIDLSAIVGWSAATSITLAWVYFAARAGDPVR